MKKLVLIIIFPLMVYSKKYDESIELGKRGDKYKVWVYFNDKKNSKPTTLSQKTIERRNNQKITLNLQTIY